MKSSYDISKVDTSKPIHKLFILTVCEFRAKQFHSAIAPSCFHKDNTRDYCNPETCPKIVSCRDESHKLSLKRNSISEGSLKSQHSPDMEKVLLSIQTENQSLAESISTRGGDNKK